LPTHNAMSSRLPIARLIMPLSRKLTLSRSCQHVAQAAPCRPHDASNAKANNKDDAAIVGFVVCNHEKESRDCERDDVGGPAKHLTKPTGHRWMCSRRRR